MTYWTALILSTVVVFAVLALTLWFLWRLENRRFATRVDRRVAQYKTEPKESVPLSEEANLAEEMWDQEHQIKLTVSSWTPDLEQRVTALEEIVNSVHSVNPPLAATPSPPTANPTTEAHWGVAEPEFIQVMTKTYSPSVQADIKRGLAELGLESVEPEDA